MLQPVQHGEHFVGGRGRLERGRRVGGRFLGPELQSASQLAQQTAWARAAFPAGEPA